MSIAQIGIGGFRRNLPVQRQAGLPPGVRQSDCDGAFEMPESGRPLWLACGCEQQESIAMQFADDHADDVRDAVLQIQDAHPDPSRGGQAALTVDDARAQSLGRALWPIWKAYRDRSLADLYHRGQIIP